jgi:hypothetical protein
LIKVGNEIKVQELVISNPSIENVINQPDEFTMTPLLSASQRGNLKVINHPKI